MSFTIDDAEDLLRLLREHPEWKARVRLEVLGEELLSLPDLVRQNSEDIRSLRVVVAENSADIRGLRQSVDDLVEVSRQHDVRLTRFGGQLGDMQGALTEIRWAQNFAGRFGGLVRRARFITPRDLERFEEADEAGKINAAEALGVRQADILVEGVMGRGNERREVVLVVEVSTTIETHDVERAIRRASTLRELGYDAVAVVAGARMDVTLRDQAVAQGVEVVLRPDDIAGWAAVTAAG